MGLDDDWVAGVRRWYFDEREPEPGSAARLASDLSDLSDPLGCEAALPTLQIADLDGREPGR
jgi:hypothetical protein